MKINLHKALRAIGQATDLISPALASHHERTAFITHMISKSAGLSSSVCRRAFIAAMIHDIGGLSLKQRLLPLDYTNDTEFSSHVINGAELLKGIPLIRDISDIVLYHYHEWNYGLHNISSRVEIPVESHVVFLADRIDTLLAVIPPEKPVC